MDTTATADRVLDHIGAQRDPMLEFLRRLVEAESPSTSPVTHEPSRRVLTSALTDLDYEVRVLNGDAGHAHVYARPAERTRHGGRQLLVGHYDTVWPVGTLAERCFEVDGNEVRGPGTLDMKGGLAQMVTALRTLRDLALEPALTPLIFVNDDEEIGSRTSTHHIRALSRISDRALILEPALGHRGRLKTARKGIGRYTISVHGKPAHAGLDPEKGSSAILELSIVIQKLFALNDPVAGISVNVGTIDGGIHANVIAPYSEAVVDVRVPDNASGERIDEAIRAITPSMEGTRIVVEGGIGRPSMEPTPRNRALWTLARGLGADLGIDLEESSAGGASDGNTTSQYTATLDGLGSVGDGAHAEHEFLYVDKALERSALLALLLLAPAGDEGGVAQ